MDSFAQEQSSSFSFSKEKGLQPVSSPAIEEEEARALSSSDGEPATSSSSTKKKNKAPAGPAPQTQPAALPSSAGEPTTSSPSANKALAPAGPAPQTQPAALPPSAGEPTTSSPSANKALAPAGPAPQIQPAALPHSAGEPTKISAPLSDQTLNPSEDSASEEITDPDIPKNSVSENFIPKTATPAEEKEASPGVSWFLSEKKTKHKIALAPVYSYNKTQGSLLGLRLFSYSSDEKGYYFALSGSKYLSSPFYRAGLTYMGDRTTAVRTESSLIYDNHYENYFGEGMETKLSDLKQIFAHRFTAKYSAFYQILNKNFYLGLGAQIFFRQEKPERHPDENVYFEDELFLFLKGFIGFDSRNNWKDPVTGKFHQLSFGCKAIFAYPGAYCQGEMDFRLYFSPFQDTELYYSLKHSVLAFRAFAGSSFISPSSYSLAYSLGGDRSSFQSFSSLRGFKQNRFRGDKIYLAQTEARFPLWKEYIDGALFVELGETAGFKKSFESFVWDYGGGLRFGIPPNYDMKLRLDFGMGKDKREKINYNFIIEFLQAF